MYSIVSYFKKLLLGCISEKIHLLVNRPQVHFARGFKRYKVEETFMRTIFRKTSINMRVFEKYFSYLYREINFVIKINIRILK